MEINEIVKIRKSRLSKEIEEISFDEIKEIASEIKREPVSLKNRLYSERLSVITEIKKTSDSGNIMLKMFEPVEISKELERCGAAALSVVTERDCYKGTPGHLRAIRRTTLLPILQRDYIVSPYQLYEARAIGADAVLLLAQLYSAEALSKYIELAASLGLECVVEVQNEQEISTAVSAGAEIINIYRRKSFSSDEETDMLARWIEKTQGRSEMLLEGEISNPDEVKLAKETGFSGIIIGDYLMKSNDYRKTLSWLTSSL